LFTVIKWYSLQNRIIIKQVSWNKTNLLLRTDLQNIQTLQLNWKLFTKVIKGPSKEGLSLVRQSILIKREAQVILI
jgi:hypothetical protein